MSEFSIVAGDIIYQKLRSGMRMHYLVLGFDETKSSRSADYYEISRNQTPEYLFRIRVLDMSRFSITAFSFRDREHAWSTFNYNNENPLEFGKLYLLSLHGP